MEFHQSSFLIILGFLFFFFNTKMNKPIQAYINENNVFSNYYSLFSIYKPCLRKENLKYIQQL